MRWLTFALMCAAAGVGAADDSRNSPQPDAALPLVANDPPPTHSEAEPIRFALGSSGKLETIGMDGEGRLVAAVSWIPSENRERSPEPGSEPSNHPSGFQSRPRAQRPADDSGLRRYAIQILSPQGELIHDWDLPDGFSAHALHATEDGELYIGGDGGLLRMTAAGKVLQSLKYDSLFDGQYRAAHSSGMSVNAEYLFLALGEGRSLQATEDVVRLKRDLTEPVVIARKQFGCCAHVDLECRTGELLIAENSRHRVNRMTFDGELIKRWGKRDRVGLEGFAACCNPVNIDLGADGFLYTAESGIGRVKKYTPQGEFVGLVGYVDTTKFDNGSFLASISCYIPVEVSADGRHVYVMDVRQSIIRVLQQIEPAARP